MVARSQYSSHTVGIAGSFDAVARFGRIRLRHVCRCGRERRPVLGNKTLPGQVEPVRLRRTIGTQEFGRKAEPVATSFVFISGVFEEQASKKAMAPAIVKRLHLGITVLKF
jgi:hypothetical protein